MKRLIHLFFLFACCICCFQNVQAQVTVLRTPQKYKAPTEKTDINKSDVGFINEPWVVFSDRDNNNTSTVRNGSADFKALKYMEPFYVIEEHQDKIHIIKASEGSNYDRASMKFTNYEDYGWVEKSKMLLWRSCMVTETSRLTRKAMVLNSIEWAKRVQRGDQTDILKFAKNPSLQSVTDEKSQLFQIFYIYKFSNDGKSLLLGKSSRIYDARQPESDIVGWAPRERLIYWDHRVALEPNWLDDAVRERKAKGIKAAIFRDATEAAKFNQNRSYDKNNVLWDDDPFQARRIGDYKRFPYYSVDANNIVRCGVWGSPTESGTGRTISIQQQAEIDRRISETADKRRNINIIFVIDGTASMGAYFRPVAEAVKSSMKNLGQTKNNINFGVVVYRDVLEGEYLTERILLTSDFNKVSTWLLKVFSDSKNRFDRDDPEAVYYGLHEAVRNLNLPEKETNYIVLVGDAGNHKRSDKSQIVKDNLINLLAAKNINLMAFQVHNKGGQAYEDFHRDAKDLIRTTALRVWKNNEIFSKTLGVNNIPELKVTGNISQMYQSGISGKVVQSPPSGQIAPANLQTELMDFISQTENSINAYIDQLNKIKEGVGFASLDPEYKPALVSILAQSGISTDQLEFLMKSRFQFYTAGFSSLRPAGFEHDLYQPVLFITRLELGQIVGDISRLLNTPTGGGARRQLYNNWLRLLEEHTGENYSSNTDIKMEDVTELLWGLPSTSRFLKEIRLGDIIDPTKFSDNELTDWMNEMDAKLKVLRRIQNDDNYQFSFKSNDEPFYWIGQMNLP